MAARFFAESFAARATPPFLPPKRPKATAAGFFSFSAGSVVGSRVSLVATATMGVASWLTSRGEGAVLERLGMRGTYYTLAEIARPPQLVQTSFHFKLTHYCFPESYFTDSGALNLADSSVAAALAHEATHVWQRQHGEWVTAKAAPLQAGYSLGLCNPYAYDRSQSDPALLLRDFMRGNTEQQGAMVQALVRLDGEGGGKGSGLAIVQAYNRHP